MHVLACVIDENNELPIGQTIVKFGLLHHCVRNGNRVTYRSEICGTANVVCEPSANANSAAVTQVPQPINASPGPHTIIGTGNAGSGAGANFYSFIFLLFENFAFLGSTTCLKDGQTHQAGDVWVSDNFKYSCNNDSSVKIIACVTDAKREIQIGEVWVLGGLKHTCSARPNGAVYSSQLCGAQVQCGPEGLQVLQASTPVTFPRL